MGLFFYRFFNIYKKKKKKKKERKTKQNKKQTKKKLAQRTSHMAMVTVLLLRTVTRQLTEPQCIRTNQKFHHKFSVFECMKIVQNYAQVSLPLSPEGYLVERWVRGCAAQIGCFFGLSGFPMAPFLFEYWFRYRLHFCKMHTFR